MFSSFIAPSIAEHCVKLIQSDHVEGLKKLLMSSSRDLVERDYQYLLLISAKQGSIHCLKYMISTNRVNILKPDHNDKIALHYAMEKGHLECILALLRATNVLDFYCSSEQLLFGKESTRPIDLLRVLGSEMGQFEIVSAIQKLLLTYYGSNTTKEERVEIDMIINDIYLDVIFRTM